MRQSKTDIIAVIVLLVAVAAFMWQRFWFWNGLAYLDLGSFYIPWYHHMGDQIRSFNIPGWNPYQLSGTLFAADPQSGWWYFPAMLFFTAFDPTTAYIGMTAFHLLLAALGTYAFARIIGLKPFAAFAAAFAYAFGPLSNHVSCCLIHVQLAVWIPPALLGVEIAVRRGNRYTFVLGCLLTSFSLSQMFAGWVGQGAYNGALLVASYAFFRFANANWKSLSLRRTAGLGIALVAGVFAVAVLMAAAGLLPRLDLVRETNVSGGEYVGHGSEDYARGWFLHELFDRLLGGRKDYFGYTFYLGAPFAVFSVLAMYLGRRGFHAIYFGLLLLITSILSLERVTPLHRLFYLLPQFESLHEHVPMRIVAVQSIAPAIMLGIGLQELQLRAGRWSLALAPLAFLPIGLSLLVLSTSYWLDQYWPLLATCAIALAVLLGSISARPWIHRWAVYLLLIVTIWEPAGRYFVQALVGNSGNPVLDLAVADVSREMAEASYSNEDIGGAGEFIADRIAVEGPFRYFGYDNALQMDRPGLPSSYREWYFLPESQSLLLNARAMGLHLYDVQGYNPVQLLVFMNFMTTLNGAPQDYHDAQVLPGGLFSPLLDLLGARYVVVPNTIPPGRPDLLHLSLAYPTVFANDSVRVLERTSALPRAWLAPGFRELPSSEHLEELSKASFDPDATVLLSPGLELDNVQSQTRTAGTVEVAMVDADFLELDVSVAEPRVLFISDIFASGWVAEVNGEETEIVLANGAFRAIVVPAGESTVQLKYEPPSIMIGFWISIATFGMAGLIVLVMLAKNTRVRRLWRVGLRRMQASSQLDSASNVASSAASRSRRRRRQNP